MSQTIDERVVEMRFDNKQFESGVKESLSTLDKLKAALNMDESAKSFAALDKAANKVSLEGISAGIEALQKRFSTLGIVGMRVIENITDSLMKMSSNAMGYVSDAIVSGGLKRAQNIENAHFQLQALLKDEEAVQAVMDNAMTSVDGTAYAYDEAAKAASQFAASGMRAGEEMISALRGITGVAAMTNSEYEGISRIFTTVAGNGRLMGDQLLQLSSRGLNAAATIADYFREVQGQAEITESDIREFVSDGQISFQTFAAAMDWAFGESAFRANETFTGALSNMRSALARIGAGFFSPLIEQNSDLILLINTLRERINDVKKAVVFDEQASAISGLTKATGMETEALEKMFSTIDKNGSVSSKNLQDLSDNGVNATKVLADYINGVVDGSIRSTYATKTALTELTGGLKVNQGTIKKFIAEGKIDLTTFTSAMENAYGDQKKISKQFTDTVLDTAKSVSEFLKNLDLTKPLQVFNSGVESVKNVFKGLYSVLKPVGQAFSEVFLSFNADSIVSLASKIENLTSKMKLTEKGSQNLHDAFTGVFNVVKLVVDGFAGLIGVVVPVSKPINSLTDLVLSLVGAMGRGLTSITDWIRNSPILSKAYATIASGVQKAMSAVSDFIGNLEEVADYIYNLPIVQKIITNVIEAFNTLYSKGGDALVAIGRRVKEFASALAEIIPKKVHDGFNAFIEKIQEIGENLSNLNLSNVTTLFGKFGDKLKELLDVFKGNEGIGEFIKNMKNYFKELTDTFSADSLFDKIEKFKDVVGGFIKWIADTIGPVFDNVSVGGVAATAGGFGLIYLISEMTKAFNKLSGGSGLLGSLDSTLGALKNTLVAYQNDLKADIMVKIAEAIAILAAALTILSFADTDRVYDAALVLGAIGTALVLAAGYLTNGIGAMKGVGMTINTVANTLAKGLNNLAKAVKWKAIGSAIKDMAVAIGVIVAAIVVLAYSYSKDSENMNRAVTLIGEIAAVMTGLIVILSALGNKLDSGMKAFNKAATGLLALAASVLIVVTALDKLMKIELPSDWETKFGILAAIFTGLTALTVVVAAASKLATSKGFYSNSSDTTIMSTSKGGSVAGPIIAAAAALYLCVVSLEKLFKMNLPSDYQEKFTMLALIFGGLTIAILALGIAGGLAGGSIKAAGSLLAMCAVIATIVGSLMILSLFPGEKLLGGAITLGMVLIALGISLSGASKASGKDSWKTVLAMALEIGVIVAAIGVLSMISGENLLKSATALGAILLVLAKDFSSVAKISNDLAWASILAMAANVGVIAVSLYVLSEQPWESLLAAATSLSAVLLSIAGAFSIISKSEPDTGSILTFLSGTVGVMVIAYSISSIASYPWDGIISAGASISAVLLSMAKAMDIISGTKLDMGSLVSFAAGLVGVAVIGTVIAAMANQPWEGMLSAAASISLVLISLAVTMDICTVAGKAAKAALVGIGLLDLFIADLAIIIGVLGALSDKFGELWSKGGNVLMDLGTYLGKFIGNIISGIGEGVASALSSIGKGLSEFANNAMDFFNIMAGVDDKVLTGTKNLAEAIILLTAAEVINGIGSFLTGRISVATFGEELRLFGTGIKNFATVVKGINGSDVETASNCALALSELYKNLPKENGWMQKITGQSKSLGDFATELVPFGKAMANYSAAVNGKIDKGAIEASTKAAEVLLAFNDKLPNMGGLAGKIFGDQKTLAMFAAEIIPFGRNMVSYSQIVAGKIDQGAIEASVTAAEVLLAFNDKLPDTGGLAQVIFGHQKTLAEFAAEIIPFGQNMVDYCNIVAGKIDQGAIEASVNAASALSALSDGLGETGGLIGLFTGGDKGLDDFGKELKKFGSGLADYSDSVSDINPQQLSSVIAEVEKLIGLARDTNGLDTSGMSGFSDALKTMGMNGVDGFITAFTDSSSKVTNAVNDFIGQVNKIVNSSGSDLQKNATTVGKNVPEGMASGVSSTTGKITSAINTLAKNIISNMKSQLTSSTFNTIGQNVITYLINGINAKKSLALTTVKNLCSSIISQFKTSLSSTELSSIGQNVIQYIVNGMNAKKSTATSTASSIANAIISDFRNSLSSSTFSSIGQNVIQYIVNGMNAKKSTATSTASSIANAIISEFKNSFSSSSFNSIGQNIVQGLTEGLNLKKSSVTQAAKDIANSVVDQFMEIMAKYDYKVFKEIGANAMQGLIDGMNSKSNDVSKAAGKIAKSVADSTANTLAVKSPSRVLKAIGEFGTIGLANGLLSKIGVVRSASEEVADTSVDVMSRIVDTLSKSIEDNPDFNPTIRPVLDLSNVNAGLDEITYMFDNLNKRFSLGTYENALAASASFSGKAGSVVEDKTVGEEGERANSYQFIQNNYSPKPLSRSEIYRQSKNLFSTWKGAVEAK